MKYYNREISASLASELEKVQCPIIFTGTPEKRICKTTFADVFDFFIDEGVNVIINTSGEQFIGTVVNRGQAYCTDKQTTWYLSAVHVILLAIKHLKDNRKHQIFRRTKTVKKEEQVL